MIVSAPGGGGLVKFAPDLTSFSDRGSVTSVSLTLLDATGSLTTLLSLTGKFVVHLLNLTLLASNDVAAIRLTIDGVVIWDESGLSSNLAGKSLIGYSAADNWGEQIRCDASLLLELQMTADTSITFNYMVRPIL